MAAGGGWFCSVAPPSFRAANRLAAKRR
jgi:hypothetical protein